MGNWRVLPAGTNALDAVPQCEFAPVMADAAVTYSPRNCLALSLRWYHMGLMDEPLVAPGTDADSTVDRFLIEADLRF